MSSGRRRGAARRRRGRQAHDGHRLLSPASTGSVACWVLPSRVSCPSCLGACSHVAGLSSLLVSYITR